MTATHPIHSRPTEELLDAGVTKDQIAALHQMSTVLFGDPDQIFTVLGQPESRGDASTMLGAIHAIRSKNPAMPGKQSEYAEKITAGINTPTVNRREEGDTPVADTKTCVKCGETKEANAGNFGNDKRTPDGLGKTCSDCKTAANSRRRATKTRTTKTKQTTPVPGRQPDPDPPPVRRLVRSRRSTAKRPSQATEPSRVIRHRLRNPRRRRPTRSRDLRHFPAERLR